MIMSENNVMHYFEDYGFNHSLFNGMNFTDSTISKLLGNMTVSQIDLFIKSWVMMQKSEDIYIAYDSSNMYTVAGSLTLAEYGHAKDDPDLPQINLSVGYNQTAEVPLFYELYPGASLTIQSVKKWWKEQKCMDARS